jgi:hypothetical protein
LTLFMSLMSLVPDLIMQLMSAGHIVDHDCRVILDLDVCYIQYWSPGWHWPPLS